MEIITIKEFAQQKKVSRQTVHSLITSKKINTSEFLGKKVIIYDDKAKNWKPEPGKRTDLKKGKK